MNEEQAKKLREKFPSSAIGQLPRGGVMLDYVGHAATTDRLLQVDPEWSWEPFSLDERGLPALDSEGNLWIKLTVCGVTRPGVGDGKTAKERIGDAIRNAAMRFGVALDLWAKEDLQSQDGDAPVPRNEQNGDLDEVPFGPEPPATTETPKRTEQQAKKLNVLVGKLRPDHITTENLYAALAKSRNIDAGTMIQVLEGEDTEGELHWAPLRDSLTKAEASDLIERLTKLEAMVAA